MKARNSNKEQSSINHGVYSPFAGGRTGTLDNNAINHVLNTPHSLPKQIKPTIQDLISFRAVAFSNIDWLTLSEGIKLNLAYSPPALLFTKYLLNKFYIIESSNKELLGFLILRGSRIRSLFVLDGFHHRKIGRTLIEFVIKDNQHLIVKPVKSSISFYKKLGFQDLGGGVYYV